MLNCVYRLVAPRFFNPVQIQVPTEGKVVVRPTYLSICNADQRYYQGLRSEEVLARKLPMALIHEGIGRVVSDDTGLFCKGDRVVMLPNNPHETDPVIAENYLRTSEFCGSGFDGFMQECVVLGEKRVLRLPGGVEDEVAAFTELVSVVVHALTRFQAIAHERRNRIGIWGDGNVGYIVALLIHCLIPDACVVVFGRSMQKLNDFTFADEVYLTKDAMRAGSVDHAFECCGGEGSASAIDQVIDLIQPEGTLALLGVSENPVPINTRMVLEKGLRVFGSSRSGRVDFERTIAAYESHPEIPQYLTSLVGRSSSVRGLADIHEAFEADMRKPMGKTVMQWCM